MAKDKVADIRYTDNAKDWQMVGESLPMTYKQVILAMRKANGILDYLIASYTKGGWSSWDGHQYTALHIHHRKPYAWINIPEGLEPRREA